MALVLHNAAAAAGQHPTLFVAGQQLASACHNQMQQTVLAMPGQDVSFVRGRISPQQLATHRPSYINALLIQSRGALVPGGCSECRRRGFTPFPECRRLVGHFGDACGNCKWRDHASRCQVVYDPDDNNNDDPDDGSDGSGYQPEPDASDGDSPAPVGQGGQKLLPAPGSASNPIVV